MEKGGAPTGSMGESDGLGGGGGGTPALEPRGGGLFPLPSFALPSASSPPPRPAFFSSFSPPASCLFCPPLSFSFTSLSFPSSHSPRLSFPCHCLLRQSKRQPKASKTEKEALWLKLSKANRHALPKLWPVNSGSSRWAMPLRDVVKAPALGPVCLGANPCSAAHEP